MCVTAIRVTGFRFSRWILAFVAALNFTAVGVAALGLYHMYGHYRFMARVRSENLAFSLAQGVGDAVSRADLSLQTIVSRLEQRLALNREIEGRIGWHLLNTQRAVVPGSIAWGITDFQGRLLMHDGENGPGVSKIAESAYFRQLQTNPVRRLFISSPISQKQGLSRFVVLSRAYLDSTGRFRGIVYAVLPDAYFELPMSRVDVGASGLVALWNFDGHYLLTVSRPGERRPEVTSLSHQLLAGIHPGSRHGCLDSSAGMKYLFCYNRLGNDDAYAVAGLSGDDYLDDWNHLFWVISISLAVLLTVLDLGTLILLRQWRALNRVSRMLGRSYDRLRASIRSLRQRDRALVAAQEAGGLGVYEVDLTSGRWIPSVEQCHLFGIEESTEWTVEDWFALIHEEDREAVVRYYWEESLRQRRTFEREYQIVRPDGRAAWIYSLGKLELDAKGIPVRMLGVVQDITRRKLVEEERRWAQEVFVSAGEGFMLTDVEGTILNVNPAFLAITGYSRTEILGQTVRLLTSEMQDKNFFQTMWLSLLEGGHWEGEITSRRKDGQLYMQSLRLSAVRDAHGSIQRFAGLIADITERSNHRRQIEFLAYHDALTGLANRALLSEMLQQAQIQSRRSGDLLGVCYMDMDDFKPVNEQYGPEAGNRLLVDMSRRLLLNGRVGDTVARLGGDEFVVLLAGCRSIPDIERASQRLLTALKQPYDIEGQKVSLTVSAGITVYPLDAAANPEELIRHADQALYQSKRRGKNRMQFFDTEGERHRDEQLRQTQRLRHALEHDEFCLHYQPKVNLCTGQVIGAEALLRWQHPVLGLVAPCYFLPAIESSGLGVELGEWVLRQVTAQIRCWQGLGIRLRISVNISGDHLQQATFSAHLDSLLKANPDVSPDSLELEILETSLLQNLDEVADCILACMELGVHFSLDDFGTGYSSLTYFRRLPFNVVKIDRSFVSDIVHNRNDQALVRSIVMMATALRRQVIAEGVETPEHGAALLRCGCRNGQGFGISRPLPASEFPGWLRKWRMPALWQETMLSLDRESSRLEYQESQAN